MNNQNSDTFNVTNNGNGQIGAVGHHNNVTINVNDLKDFESIDLSKLADDLSRLIEAMKKECTKTEHYTAVGKIVEAQEAAKSDDVSKVKEYLKSAGTWSLDIASKIGVGVALEALKKSIGI